MNMLRWLARHKWLGGVLFLWLGAVSCIELTTSSSDDLPQTPAGYSNGWTSFAPGVEFRTLPVTPPNGFNFDMHIVRLDPAQVQFRVHYRSNDPYTFARWQATLQSNALVFVNANFFTEDYQAIGLVIADGIISGTSLFGYGGMFQVDFDGNARLRSLVQEPYRGEVYQQVIQSFPMLIEPGGFAASTGAGFDDPSRRTVIAQDRSGFILLMTTGLLGEISFNDLQTWLFNSGLDLQVAFALDGGKSTAMYVARPSESPITVSAFSVLPTVLAVYGR